ncbi:MAG: type I glyceraldehyde-3-phosphate dehydrogenase [Chloroflexota bacterium]|nr:type I glyceraldehyde-3-phosphate dehydrogenase [Chloroflexota bacterium]
MARVAINGFGRIGRQVFKTMRTYYPDELEVVAVNDLTDNETLAHLLKYDSNYGRYEADISVTDSCIRVDDVELSVYSQRDWTQLPWAELGVDLVVESSSVGTDADRARAHLAAGAKKVVISAPAKNEDITLVYGVNEDLYDPEQHHIISNASCTTNALALVTKVLLESFGIVRGMVTTVHSYTNDQVILDAPHKDLRRARSAPTNMIPTTTGAARALGTVLPDAQGKLDMFALRVPTPTVSLIDFVAELERDTTVEELNRCFQEVASGKLERVMGYTEEPLVSGDFKEESRTTVIDGLSTMVVGNRMAKVISWYDNEWSYSVRLADVLAMIANRGL